MRFENISYRKSTIKYIRGFLSVDGGVLRFTKYKGEVAMSGAQVYNSRQAMMLDRKIQQIITNIFKKEKEIFKGNVSDLRNINYLVEEIESPHTKTIVFHHKVDFELDDKNYHLETTFSKDDKQNEEFRKIFNK